MDKELLKQLQEWHETGDYEMIINTILDIPKDQRDYDLIGQLARAYNNNDEYDKAIEQLLSVKEQGENDSLWLFRLAYAFFYLDEYETALELFEKCKKINPKEPDADFFINLCKENLSDNSDDDPEQDDEVEKTMQGYTAVVKHKDSISVCFYIEQDKPFSIGGKMNEINEEAYMNGYNWEAFFNYYLPKYAPDVMEGMDTDPEAGMYAAYYNLTPDNEKRAEKFAQIIRELVENEDELYRIVREEGDNIEWD